MRNLILAIALPIVLAACSGSEEGANTSGFKPPMNVLRADLAANFERNFARLDRNHDGAIEASEVPRRPKLVARLDLNRDGRVTLEEFRTGQLAHFDRGDINHDGTLTTAERQARSVNDRD